MTALSKYTSLRATLVLLASLAAPLSAQNIQWIRTYYAASVGGGAISATDANGGLYIAGDFRGVGTTIPCAATVNSACDVRKVNPDGSPAWATKLDPDINAINHYFIDAIAAGPCGAASCVYVAGHTQSGNNDFVLPSPCTSPGLLLSPPYPACIAAGGTDVFVARLNGSTGALEWMRQFGGGANDYPTGVAVDSADAVYVVGQAGAGGLLNIAASFEDGGVGQAAFVSKFDTSGTHVWTKQFTSTSGETGATTVVVADQSGSGYSKVVYVLGVTNSFFAGEVQVDLSTQGGPFVRKYTGAGIRLWTTKIYPGSNAYPIRAALVGSDLYVAGEIFGSALPGQTFLGFYDAFVLKFATGGFVETPPGSFQQGSNVLWARQFGSPENLTADGAFGIAANSSAVYVAGQIGGTLPGQTFAGGASDAFVRKYDPAGAELWTRQFGTDSGSDYAQTISLDGVGNAYVAGYAPTTFLGSVTLEGLQTSTPGLFVAKFPAITPTTTTVGAITPEPSFAGQSYSVAYSVTSSSGTPTGNVTVSDGSASCTAPVAAATCSLTSTTAGTKTITASYAGDTNFESSSNTKSHTVTLATTTTVGVIAPEPSSAGQSYAVAYTVTSTGGAPSGNVTVSDGSASCTATVAAATCSLTSTTSGTKTITANYLGGGNFNPSSGTKAHVVSLAIPPAIAGPLITTVAGNGTPGSGTATPNGDGGLATAASLQYPAVAVVDGSGNLLIADTYNHRVRRVNASTGIITTVAGTGDVGFSGDGGLATAAMLSEVTTVALDGAGNLVIADRNNNRIRRVNTSTGIISTVAGSAAYGSGGDGGPATSAALNVPFGVAVDGAGNIVIADSGNNRIRRVDASTGIITTVAGNGTAGYSGDGGLATAASLNYPNRIAVDSAGNILIPDGLNNRVRRVSASTGIITTVAGGGLGGDGGPATSAALNSPYGVAVDGGGNILIAEGNRIRRVSASTGIISTVAGNGSAAFSGDNGPATAASLRIPAGVTVDNAGNLLIADAYNHRIRRVTPTITTVAGTGTPGSGSATPNGDNGPATAASLLYPSIAVVDGSGNLIIADNYDHRIRRVDASTGVITTLAGTGANGFSGDGGPATAATLSEVTTVALDGAGNLLIADRNNNRIRRVNTGTGIIATVAGGGSGADGGPATSAVLSVPFGVAVDGAGNIVIADSGNNRVRRVDASTGIITTVAGNGSGGYSGDGGPATAATLNYPNRIAVDSVGNIIISDGNNHRVRRVSASTGIITTVAGNGIGGYSGDGSPATAASLNTPYGVAVDGGGNILIADMSNSRIRRVSASTGSITTVAGNGSAAFGGDNGPATTASINNPAGVTVDATGNLLIADSVNHRVRRVMGTALPASNPGTVPPPPNTSTGTNVATPPISDPATGAAATMTFSSVTQGGSTTLTSTNSGPPPPSGFSLGNPPTYYDISTTASFSGAVSVCINYGGTSFAGDSNLKLYHFENGVWVDRTISLDATNKIICGSVTSFSLFAIARPAVIGPAATIQVLSAFHAVGAGTTPAVTKTPLALSLKVFDLAMVPPPDPVNFGTIYAGTGLTTVPITGPTQVQMGGGTADLYTIAVPAGRSYLVIGKATVGTTSPATVFVGSPTDLLAQNSTTQKYLQVIQNGAGKIQPAKTTAVPGSLLLITEPEYLEFTSSTELYPIIYESVEGVWQAVVTADPPHGFVANPGAIQVDVSDNLLRPAQFTIRDVGSDWTNTKVTHHLRHNGKETIVVSTPRMINRRKP